MDWPLIRTGANLLEFLPNDGSPDVPIPLANLELTSGPINDLDLGLVPEPGCLALLLVGAGLLAARRPRG